MNRRRLALGLGTASALILLGVLIRSNVDSNDASPTTDSRTSSAKPSVNSNLLSKGDSNLKEGAEPSVGLRSSKRAETSKDFVRLVGKVIDASTKKPVAGADISLMPHSDSPMSHFGADNIVAHLSSAEDGSFHFDKLTPGTWRSVVWHPNYMPSGTTRSDYLADKGAASAPFLIAVPKDTTRVVNKTYEMTRGRTLRGRVVDENGEGITNAEIRLRIPEWLTEGLPFNLDDSVDNLIATPAPSFAHDGSFSLGCIPPMVKGVQIAAYVEGHACQYESADNDGVVLLRVLRCASVAGKVTTTDGRAATGVRVALANEQVTYPDNWAYREVEASTSDVQGAYELAGLPPTDCRISARWEYAMSGSNVSVEALRPGEPRRGTDIAVRPPVRVIEALVLGPDGKPSPSADIRVRTKGVDHVPVDGWNEDDQGMTDGSGLVTIQTRLPEPLQFLHETLDATHILKRVGGLADGAIRLVTPATTRTVDIRVGTTIGRDLSTFNLTVSHSKNARYLMCSTRSDGDSVKLVRYEEPPYFVKVSHARSSFETALFKPKTLSISADDLRKPIEIMLEPAGPRQLVFLDPNGRLFSGVRILFKTRHWRGENVPDVTISKEIARDEDGSFPVPLFEKHFYSSSTLEVNLPNGYVPVTVRYDHRSYYEPIVPIRAGTISGNVVFPDSLPKPHSLTLTARWRVARDEPNTMARSVAIRVDEETGAFRSDQIPADREIELTPDKESLELLHLVSPAPLDVRAGDSDIEVKLSKGATIRGRISVSGTPTKLGVQATPLQGDSPIAYADVLPDLTFLLEGLSRVPHRVVVVALGNSWTRLAEKTAQPNEAVHFDIGALGMLKIQEVDEMADTQTNIWDSNSTDTYGKELNVTEGLSWMECILPKSHRYDVVSTSKNIAAYKLGVRTGDTVRLSFAPSTPISVRLDRACKEGEYLFFLPRRKGPRFVAERFETKLRVEVLPGQYDIVYRGLDGTLTTLARGIHAGQVVPQLQLPPYRAKPKK